MFRAVLPYYLLDLLLWSQQLDSLTEAHACRACYGWALAPEAGAIPVKSDLRQTKLIPKLLLTCAAVTHGAQWRRLGNKEHEARRK